MLSAWLDAFRLGSVESLEALFAEDVVWEGPIPGTICRGRRETLARIGRWIEHPPRITKLEAAELAGESDNTLWEIFLHRLYLRRRRRLPRVVLTAEGPDFFDLTEDQAQTPRERVTIVATVKDGRVIHMQGLA